MLALYLFSLIVGGGFLLLSVLGGGGEGDLDMDGGLDLDVGGDLELDALEGDVLEGVAELDGAEGGDAASRIFSLRTVVYALFGFGATGSLLTWAGVGLITTLAFSVVGGLASGLLVSLVFHYLVRTASGGHPGDQSLVGLPGTVSLPMGVASPGTILVERDGRRLSLRALPHSAADGDPGDWRRVIVVDMDGGVARVAPLEADDLDALGSGEP